MAKATHGYNRTVKRTVRLSPSEDCELVERAKQSGAKTPSGYLRYTALHGPNPETPAWEHLRATIHALTQNTNELRRAGWSKALEAKAMAVYEWIIRY